MKKLIASILIAALLAILSSLKIPTFAATSNQTNVSVNVTELMKITVSPVNLTWFAVTPSSEGEVKYLDIKNTGSVNISAVYGYVSSLEDEPTNPIPTGSAEAYAAGGVLVLKKNESDAKWYYAGRIEWNISKPTNAGGTYCENAVAWGYYRNVSGDYLWCLVNDSSGFCNSTSAKIYIENDIDDGSASTRQPEVGGNFGAEVGNWGIYSFTGGPLEGHCVAAYYDCSRIYIYRYDRRSNPNFEACPLSNEQQSLRYVNLTPGDQFTINAGVWIPWGIPAGWLKSSWLTIEAGSA